jgi:hypothetical protein
MVDSDKNKVINLYIIIETPKRAYKNKTNKN